MNVATTALRKVRAIERKIEDKFITTSATATAITDSGTITELFPLVQGDDFGQRNGNKVQARWMEFRAEMRGVGSSSTLRVIIFRDNQQQADTDPTIAQVLQSVSFLSPINHINRQRFYILRDMSYTLNLSSANAVISVVQYIKLNFEQRYNGAAATDIDKNGIYLLLLGSNVSGDPTHHFNAAMHFSDL